MCSSLLNTVGLILDIAGVVLLFFFGLPSDVSGPSGGTLILWPMGTDGDAHEARKYKRYHRTARLGLGLLIVGFALQAVSNHI